MVLHREEQLEQKVNTIPSRSYLHNSLSQQCPPGKVRILPALVLLLQEAPELLLWRRARLLEVRLDLMLYNHISMWKVQDVDTPPKP
jgi:hypothetical protein